MIDSPSSDEMEVLASAVHVWACAPNQISASLLQNRALGWLSEFERETLEQIQSDELRHEFLLTRAICREKLSAITGVDPQDWRFEKSPNGKPFIAAPSEFRQLRFSLTHTQDYAACAITRAGEVGVDAEWTRRHVDVDSVARHFLALAECEELARLDPQARLERFFELWVLKEAYLKGTGAGLSQLDQSRATPLAGSSSSFTTDDGWQTDLHRPTPEHVAATAVRPDRAGTRVSVRWDEFDGVL
jgi:4'-phosphopantetheinyl transferase